MNFNWDIDTWAQNETPGEIRYQPWTTWLRIMLKPVKYLYNLFLPYRAEMLKKLRYNSQTIILENLLNDMFDNNLRRIRIITTYDVVPSTYIFTDAESEQIYVYTEAEVDADPTKAVYLYTLPELGVLYDFIVQCAAGSLTELQENRLKAIVNYYRLAGKKPLFIYDDNTTF